MARTVNRQPFTVKTPNSSDIKDYFFNQVNWKGMNDNRNFLAVDQESFEQCNNVYVNSEGLLRSRPSVKLDGQISNLVEVKIYGDFEVYVKFNVVYSVQVKNKIDNSVYDFRSLYNTRPAILFIENVIYVFGSISNGIEPECFNTTTKHIEYLVSHLYIPETKIISGQEEVENETANSLISSKKEVYLYSNDLVLRDDIDGKKINFTIDGVEYVRNEFQSDETLVFYQKFLNLSNTFVDNVGQLYMESFWDGTNDTFFVYSLKTGQLMYSPDGKRYTVNTIIPLELLSDDFYSLPHFTADGHHVYRGKDIISVVKDVESNGALSYRLSTLTDLSIYIGASVEGTAPARFYVISHNHLLIIKSAEISGNPYFRLYEDVNSYTDYVLDPDQWFGGYVYDVKYFPNYEGNKRVVVSFSGPGFNHPVSVRVYTLVEPNGGLNGSAQMHHHDFTSTNVNASSIFLNYDGIMTFAHAMTEGTYYFTFSNYSFSDSERISNSTCKRVKGSDFSRYIATDEGLYDLSTSTRIDYLIDDVCLLSLGKHVYFVRGTDWTKIYSNSITEPVQLVNFIPGIINQTLCSMISKHSVLIDNYISADNQLYISSSRYDDDGNFLLYLPDVNKHTFNYTVTGLIPISSSEMGIFLTDEIWYVKNEESAYYYIKSKLDTGLKSGSDVILSADGTNVMFTNERGMVALTYQNFVATTDQVLTYLSDAIFETFLSFINHLNAGVKLRKYKFWIIAYKEQYDKVFLLDLPNGSWWPWTLPGVVNQLFVDNYKDLNLLRAAINCKLVKFDLNDVDYYDFVDYKTDVVWSFKSQKLHFDAINYYKHISNLTLYSVLDGNQDAALSFYLRANNYRKKMDTSEIQTVEYEVDTIRTFVKRVNYPKVNEFQYEIRYKDEDAVKYPLSLSGLTIKYKINGQVR